MFKQIFTYLSIALIVGLIVNNVCFTHIHILETGQVQQHAHPFNKSESQDTNNGMPAHTHTHAEYAMLSQLMLLLGVVIFVLAVLLAPKPRLFQFYRLVRVNSSPHYSFSLRGPPSV